MSDRKVAVTGLGILLPVDNNVPGVLREVVCPGKNRITLLMRFEYIVFSSKFTAELHSFEDIAPLIPC